ncbi:MAG: hypothetical protein GX616_01330, partial [Planctomycetes bacterium]|nr:hypothetical protein [Planctomycetota bacterium]
MSRPLPAWIRLVCALLFTFTGIAPAAAATPSAMPAALPAQAPQPAPAADEPQPIGTDADRPAVQAETPLPAGPLTDDALPLPADSDRPAMEEIASPSLEFALDVEPAAAVAGAELSLTLLVTNIGGDAAEGLALRAVLADGLIYSGGDAFTYDPESRQLEATIPALPAGATQGTVFLARLDNLIPGSVVTQVAELSWPGAATPLTGQVQVTVAEPEPAPGAGPEPDADPGGDEGWIDSAGGQFRSRDGRITLDFPPGAVTGRTRISYAPAEAPVEYAGLRYTFSLEAMDEAGRDVSTFQAPVTLIYRPVEDAADEAEPPIYREHHLYLWDEVAARWIELAVTRDSEAGALQAELPHFSIYSDGSIDYVAEQMATVRGAQTSLFTRSVVYGTDFDLPPGRGGLTPRLGLSYSSAGHTPDAGHFSHPGFGWQLSGADSIYTAPGDANVDKPILTLQGVNYSLRKTDGGSWFAEENPFLRITASDVSHYTPATWVVRTPDGVAYTFSGGPSAAAHYFKLCGKGEEGPRYVRIPLTSVVDALGNTVTYTWDTETQNTGSGGGNCDDKTYGRAIRLASISYNNAAVKVNLTYGERTDRPSGYDSAPW